MSFIDSLISLLPEVKGPREKKLPFKQKMKWTLITLILFFVMGLVPLFGLGQNSLQRFEFLSIILGANFGSILSLGIGPLVTSSIVLQLLNGSGLIKFNLSSHEGRARFQGVQKLLAVFFIVFEAAIYVFMGGLSPAAGSSSFFQLELILIFQLMLGGILIMFMDEVISKWGFGSGISLFIVAGVAQQVFLRAFNFLPSPTNPNIASGAVPAFFQSLAAGDLTGAGIQAAAVIATVVVFFIVVYVQAMKVEIPLSVGMVRGHGIRWPLNFFYTSNIPVILVAALLANVQLWASLLDRWGHPWFGTFDGAGNPISGLVLWVASPNLLNSLFTGGGFRTVLPQALVYVSLMVVGSVIFAIFWMQTANMDAKSQADQIMSSGLQIPGFRRDARVLESVLNRYIWPLTVMGGATVGLIAALADLTGALSRGTGILLSVMIVYKLYEEIAKQHMMDMHPMMRRFME